MSHDASLEPILRQLQPAVRLVPERYLLQVLEYLIDLGQQRPTNTRLPYWVSRADLENAGVLPPEILEGTEPELLLVTDPDDRLICRLPVAEQLLAYWRVLFQAAVMREIDRQIAAGRLSEVECERRLDGFGLPAEREVRYVLEAEQLTCPRTRAASIYRTFAAIGLDLAHFDRERLEVYFPSLSHQDRLAEMLGEGLDIPALIQGTRPEGAAEPIRAPIPEFPLEEDESAEGTEAPEGEAGGLLARAREAARKKNYVRAAILHTQIAAVESKRGDDRLRQEESPEQARAAARAALGHVVQGLAELFQWDHSTREEWRQALAPLLDPAAMGVWPRAARCLYELQKIPADLSREVYAVDLAESIRTLGRRPIKRPLPHARPVLILMHLKKAHQQLIRAGLSPAAHLRLDRLFAHQVHLLEHDVRNEFTPIINDVLSEAGLVPANTVEVVARDKLTAELLDRVCERGYLRLADLRDAIARNRLKMPDLAGLGEFFSGDPLLRADVRMAYALDGVYQKGEFYLRWIQRMSSVFFGTPLGRVFTIYLAIPFGGAFLALMFAEELSHLGGKLVSVLSRPQPQAKAPPQQQAPAQNAQAPPPEVIQADQVELDEDHELVIWYPSEVVTSDEVELDKDGNVVWIDSTEGKSLAAQVFTSSATEKPTAEEHHGSFLVAWPTILGFGVFLLLMFHVPVFRRSVFACLGYLWWCIRGVLWDIPMSFWRSPTVRVVRQSRAVRFLIRHFWTPTFLSLLLFSVLFVIGFHPVFLVQKGWPVWAVLTLAYNTRWGWLIQDRLAQAIWDWWRVVRTNLIPGIIATIVDWFRMLGNWIERRLYAVDEWLRYRSGDSQGSLALKAFLGLLWFPIAYTFRFVFYLLVEPQINPVKHFPVVTVSHKVIWPMVPEIAHQLQVSPWTVGMVVNGIPGIFGFIAWELKENWRLYAANRSARLEPVMIGSHGETMRGLLCPGFHSGTVPRLYRKLRHAETARLARLHHDLEHSGEAVERFACRELIDLLRHSTDWGGIDIELEAVHFGCQRVVLELSAADLGGTPFRLSFENIGGKIEAFIEQVGWAAELTEPQRSEFLTALSGLLDMAAVVRFNGGDRLPGASTTDSGFDELFGVLTWKEWVEQWGGKKPETLQLEARGSAAPH
jgi:hypothetical protein